MTRFPDSAAPLALLAALLLALPAAGSLLAQPQTGSGSEPDSAARDSRAAVRYRAHADSRFWIEGDANVRAFECHVDVVRGGAVLRDSTRALPAAGTQPPRPRDAKARRSASSPASPLTAEVAVPVRRFDCGKDPMNEDLYEALKAEDHPQIRYRLQRVRLLPPTDTSAWRPVRTTGALTVAGSTRTVTVRAFARRLDDGRMRVRGEKPLRMTSFGVTPPEALLGMIEVHDRIVVHFDLVGIRDDQSAPSH